ncbi:hypothetical protein LQ318_06030 [Aliifodinibius salicampi]|uniref:Transposase DDE domain-containing protein n=1 Tax=Fodinibius salicampi TaxID=1920655 RepID=A0ABT3PX89_9BACT|nr:hypothetical protein [Fodinibius salicampi]MCW9712461.1 hypothetical protein [Fodinibius salicampi]
MQTVLKEKVNVDAVFRSFKDSDKHTRSGWEHKRIQPRYVKRKKGEVLTITDVRRSYAQRKGERLQVHFVICCEGERYFHLVYDADKILWVLLYEFDDQMLFDEKEINVDISME